MTLNALHSDRIMTLRTLSSSCMELSYSRCHLSAAVDGVHEVVVLRRLLVEGERRRRHHQHLHSMHVRRVSTPADPQTSAPGGMKTTCSMTAQATFDRLVYKQSPEHRSFRTRQRLSQRSTSFVFCLAPCAAIAEATLL